MRTIAPILKSACQTGNGLPIASAVIHSTATPPLADQNFNVVKYNMQSEELTATIRGDEVPNIGKIIISRGYSIGGIEYTEALTPFLILDCVEKSEGEFEIKANAFKGISFDDGSGGGNYARLGSFIESMGYDNFTITVPEYTGQAESIFYQIATVPESYYNNANQALYKVATWPLVRYYLTETGIIAVATFTDSANITNISIIASYQLRFNDELITLYTYGVDHYAVLGSLNYSGYRASGKTPALTWNPSGASPNIIEAVSSYYNELYYARSFFLLADMELEEGDRFEYDGYTWRIESISEKYGSEFSQSLFCLRIIPPDYLLLEVGDNILLESGDDILME